MWCLPRTRGDRWRRASTAGAEERWLLWANAGRTIDHAMMGVEVLNDCPQSARRASQFGVIICREGTKGLMSRGFPTAQPATRQAGGTVGGLGDCGIARWHSCTMLLLSSGCLRPRQKLRQARMRPSWTQLREPGLENSWLVKGQIRSHQGQDGEGSVLEFGRKGRRKGPRSLQSRTYRAPSPKSRASLEPWKYATCNSTRSNPRFQACRPLPLCALPLTSPSGPSPAAEWK